MKDGSPITEMKSLLIRKLAAVRFPPGTASKRFARDLASGYIKQLSPRGRKFLAWVLNRFRAQVSLTNEEHGWVIHWLFWEDSGLPNLGVSPSQPGSIGENRPLEKRVLQAQLPFPE